MPPTASLQRHKEPRALRLSGIAPEETVLSPITPSPIGGDRLVAPLQAKQRSPSQPNSSSHVPSSFRRGTSLFSKSSRSHSDPIEDGAIEDILAGDPIVYNGGWVSVRFNVVAKILSSQAKSPGREGMIRERVSINGIIRLLEAERDLPALQIMPELLGAISEHWIYRYIAGTENHQKKFAARIKHVAKHRERTVADLRRQGPSQPHASESKMAVAPEWSLAWALDADEHPPPSSLVARRDVAEALALARGAKRGRRAGRGDAEKAQRLETKGRERVGAFWKRHCGSRPDAAPPQAAAVA